jgi:hypothetical protein
LRVARQKSLLPGQGSLCDVVGNAAKRPKYPRRRRFGRQFVHFVAICWWLTEAMHKVPASINATELNQRPQGATS